MEKQSNRIREIKKELVQLDKNIKEIRRKILDRINKSVKLEKISLKKILYARTKLIKELRSTTDSKKKLI